MDAITLLAKACTESILTENAEDQPFSIDAYGDGNVDSATPSKIFTRGSWTPDEDDLLRNAVELYGGRNWKRISEKIPDRTDVQCLHRWQKVLRPGLIKGPWTPEARI